VLVLFYVIARVERPLAFVVSMAIRTPMVSNESLDGGHQSARNGQKVPIENPYQIEERIESRHDLAGLDAGDVHLRQAQTSS